MPTLCNVNTSYDTTCPLGVISQWDVVIKARGTVARRVDPSANPAGTILATFTTGNDAAAFAPVEVPGPAFYLPLAWSGTISTGIVADIDELVEDIDICITVTDSCGTSDEICDTLCVPSEFTITSYTGVPGTEEGTVTYTSGAVIGNFGTGPYTVFREYDVTFSNGLTAHVRSDGTTANQMLWMATNINSGGITYRKNNSSNTTLSNGSNVPGNWDDPNTEGAIVTWTFPQPVEKLSLALFDFDSDRQAAADVITPEATHWQHTQGFADGLGVGLGINPSGVYQYIVPDPSALTGLADNNNRMILYWDFPVTTVSMRINERATINMKPTALYCEIPSEATEAVYVPAEPPGQIVFDTEGATTWTVPAGVTSISAVAVGAGGGGASGSGANNTGGHGGGGGSLMWANNISVTPGEILNINVGVGGTAGIWNAVRTGGDGGNSSIYRAATPLLEAEGGKGGSLTSITGATLTQGGLVSNGTGDGGGNGGFGGSDNGTGGCTGGGGGAGGYTGAGGQGAVCTGNGLNGSGGGAGGGGRQANGNSGGGGGVGLLGEGLSGLGGASAGNQGGGGGSGGANGVNGLVLPVPNGKGGDGGSYGGGGGSADDQNAGTGGYGAGGAIRIMWGDTRSYPNDAADV